MDDEPDGVSAQGRRSLLHCCTCGIETIEVALVTALMLVIILAGMPVLTGSFQNAMDAVINTLSTAASSLN